MKKWTKILSVVVILLVALVVALVVLANVLITPERVKETLLPLAEENLNRKIDLGNIEVSLFSGIEIHGLTVYEEDGNDVFVSTDLVRLKYQLLPLLAMKVVIDEVRLERPSIRVVRFKDGQFNFSDLLNPSDNESSPSDPSTGSNPSNEQDSIPLSLLVSNLLLQDGHLTFLDHTLNDEAPYRYEISSLQIAAKGISFTGEIPLSVQCQFNGSQLALDGHVSLLPLAVNFKVELQDLDAVAFKPYLQDVLPGEMGGLKVNLESTVSGTPDEIGLKGSLSFTDLDLLLDAMPDAPLENAKLGIDYDVLFVLNQETLDIRQLGLDYNSIKVNTTGKISGLLSALALDLTVMVPKLQIRQAIDAVPAGLLGDVGSLDPAGSLSIEAVVSGNMDEAMGLLKSATIDLEDVQATVGGQRPAFSGQLLLAGDKMSSEGLQLRLGDNHADIYFDAYHLFSDLITVTADISSERFLIEPLLVGSAGSMVVTDQSEEDVEEEVSEEVGPFDIPLHAKGTITVNEALWKELVINDFIAQYELKDNIFKLARMDGQVAGGSFNNNARVDLGIKGLAYSVNLDLKQIQADQILTALAPQTTGSLLGSMDLVFAFDGRGTKWQTLNRNLSGEGKIQAVDGTLLSKTLVYGLNSFLQLPELEELQFDDLSGQFTIVNGRVKVDGTLLSKAIKLFPKGTVGLDGSLNMGLDLRLSPELSKKLDKKITVSRYLADENGWTRMPLLIKGDFASPIFSLDPKGVQEQASKAISKEIGRQIDKLFKRSESKPQETEQQAENDNPARKLLQDSLQKLFGN